MLGRYTWPWLDSSHIFFFSPLWPGRSRLTLDFPAAGFLPHLTPPRCSLHLFGATRAPLTV